MPNENVSDMRIISLTIPANARDTAPFDTKGRGIAAVLVTGGWTTSALNVMTQFAVADPGDSGTFYEVYLDDGTQVGIGSGNMSSGRLIYLAPDAAGVGFKWKTRLHSAQVQTSERTVLVLLRGF